MEENKAYMVNHSCVISDIKLSGFGYNGESMMQKVPELNFDAEVTIPASTFKEAITHLAKLGESVTLYLKESELNFSLPERSLRFDKKKGFELKQGAIDLIVPVTNTTNKNAVSKYSIEFLKQIIKSFPAKVWKEHKVILKWSTDYPLKIEVYGNWIIMAPRVSND